MTRSSLIIFNFLIAFAIPAVAQEIIPLGEWRIHTSYNNINSVARGNGKIFAAARNGVVVIDQSDNSFVTWNKLNVLTRSDIRLIGYHASAKKTIVVYKGGTFDVIDEKNTTNFDPAKNTVLTGPREIYDISFNEKLCYLSTDYGVLLFDLDQNQIRETWRDLGPAGETLKIFSTTFFSDSVFLATDAGVLAGNPADNLLDFNKWKRMSSGDLTGSVNFIQELNAQLYAFVNGQGLYQYDGEQWNQLDILAGRVATSMEASSQSLVLCESGRVWKVDADHNIVEISHDQIQNANFAIADDDGTLWVGDSRNGVVVMKDGSTESIVPNGPAQDISHRLSFFNNTLYSVPGGFSGTAALLNEGVLSMFKDGIWTSSSSPVKDLTGVAVTPAGDVFLASFGYGVYRSSTQEIYDESNSTLVNVNPPDRNVRITDIISTTAGLWVANQGTSTSLHLLTTENQWRSVLFPFSQAVHPLKIIEDFEGNVWMVTNPAFGGGIVVYSPSSNESVFLDELDNRGELPSSAVYSLAVDWDGYVWAGTDAGVAYFYDKDNDAVKPIFENRFLLRDEKVTAIAVDGGNRKWMGTERGVWLFDPTGEQLIRHYTSANSPLLSDKIMDIAINQSSGEVYFATDAGLVSFRSDASASNGLFDNIKIFPNPVVENFTGQVGISGLATDAVVKITDVAGKLIFQTVANGGTASWNVRDHYGRRVPTGVFLVFAVRPDGSESVVGKIAVIN